MVKPRMPAIIEEIDNLEIEINRRLNSGIDNSGFSPEEWNRIENLMEEQRDLKEEVVAICRKAVS